MKCPSCGEDLIKTNDRLICLKCGSSGRVIDNKKDKQNKKVSRSFNTKEAKDKKKLKRKTEKEQPNNIKQDIKEKKLTDSEIKAEVEKAQEENMEQKDTKKSNLFEVPSAELEFKLQEKFSIHNDWWNMPKIEKLGKNVFYLIKVNSKKFIKLLRYYLKEVYNNLRGKEEDNIEK